MRRLRLALALVALAAGLVNLALIVRADDARPRSLLYLLIAIVGVSWSFVAAGLVAWSRRPDNRTGALMVAVGLAYTLLGLRLVGTPWAFTLHLLLASLPVAILAHLIAVFPDGRATTRLQHVFIVANYATTVPLAFVQLLLVDPERLRCAECPHDLLGSGGVHPYGEAVVAVSDLWDVLLAGLLLWIVVTRWRRAPAPRRRSLAPVVQVAVVLLILFIVRQALRAVLSPPPPWLDGALDLAVLTTLMLWPLGFLAGLARSRLDRSAVGDLAIELEQARRPAGSRRHWPAPSTTRRSSSLTGCPTGRPSSTRRHGPSSCPRRAAAAASRSCATMATWSPPWCTTPPSTTSPSWCRRPPPPPA